MTRKAAIAAGAPVAPEPKPVYIPDLSMEHDAWRTGAHFVAGVDEVGVGPLAGPVTGGVVMLEPGQRFDWYDDVRDSKVLPAKVREELSALIRASVAWGIGWVSPEEIDRVGILPARRLCMMRAIEALPVRPDAVISDALDLPIAGLRAEIRADARSVAVAAASIVAKVARDALLVQLCEQYPGYGLCRNKGYPTPEHKRLLQRRGPSPIHRRSYQPVAQMVLPL